MGHDDQQPSSPVIVVSAPAHGWVKGGPWFLRWLAHQLMPAGRAQAILPSIPALKCFLTAETGGGTRIRGGF
jgi:hypothetical protein